MKTLITQQQEALIEHACSKLILRAAALADAGNATELAALFTEDGTLVRPGAAELVGRRAIEASYAARPSDRLTRHIVTNILVTVESEDQARAVSSVLLWTANASGTPSRFGLPTSGPQVIGEFHDALQMTEEGWRIGHRVARFLMHTPN